MKEGIALPEDLQRLLLETALGEERAQRFATGKPRKRELAALAESVRELTDSFAREGSHRPRLYADSPRLKEAYMAYFLPGTFARGQAALDELWPTLAGKRELRVLDVGCGLGALSLAVMELASRRGEIERVRIEGAEERRAVLSPFRTLARTFARALAKGERQITFDIQTSLTEIAAAAESTAEYDIILVGNALGALADESGNPARRRAGFLASLSERLADDGAIVVIESPSHSSARALQATRDELIASHGLWISAPCLRQANCPMLDEGWEKHWCHTGAIWTRPQLVRQIDGVLGRKRFVLKFSYLVVRKTPLYPVVTQEGMTAFRAVGDLLREKGKSRIMLCGEPGCRMTTLLKRDITDATDGFTGLHRGDIVAVDVWGEKGDGWRLAGEARVEVLKEFSRR